MGAGNIFERYQQYVPANPADYPGAAPSTSGAALDAVALMTNLANSRQVYVDAVAGNDATATGAKLRPYQTIEAALAAIVADVTLTDYTLMLAPGSYGAAPIAWPVIAGKNISVFGDGESASISQTITYTSIGGASEESVVFFNVSLQQLDVDLSAAAAVPKVSQVALFNCGAHVRRLDSSAPGAQIVRLFNCLLTGLATSSTMLLFGCQYIGGSIAVNASGELLAQACLLAGCPSVTVAGTLFVSGCLLQGSALSGAGTLVSDASSLFPGAPPVSNTITTQVHSDTAPLVGYNPAVPGNWIIPPTQVAQALDELAAAVPPAGGANITLSNLNPTSINQDLIPDANNTRDIGSVAKKWKDGHFAGNVNIDGKLTVLGLIDPTQVLLTGPDKKFGATDAGTVYLAPFADQVDAVAIRKADDTTTVVSVDTANAKVGVNTNAPEGALEVVNTVDDPLNGSLMITGQGAADTVKWAFYSAVNGILSIINKSFGAKSLALNDQGRVALGSAAFGHPNAAVLAANQTGDEAIPTIAVKKIALQTGDAITVYDTDEVTVLAKVDIAGKGTFTGLDASSHLVQNVAAPVAATDAANKNYVDSAVSGSGAVLANGSVPFTADESMGGHKLTSLAAPAAGTDATNKTYVDAGDATVAANAAAAEALDLRLDGSRVMTGALDMGTHQIHNVVDPTSPQDAATKAYVDSASSAETLAQVLTNGNDGGAKQIKNILDPTLAQDASTKAYTDAGDATVAANAAAAEALDLRLDGSRAMTGALNMNTHLIHNVVDPVVAQDAATKNYVDTAIGASGAILANGTVPFAADESMGGHKLTNLAAPAAGGDATNKTYVDAGDATVAANAAAAEALDLRLDGSRVMTGALDMGTHLIHNVVNPVAAQDAATKSYVDALATFQIYAVVNVAMNGSDVTGNGSANNPYQTVTHAMSTILDATNLKRYAINVAPGRYAETGLTLKPNVFIIGEDYLNTRIANNVAIALDATFNVANDCRSGFININIASAFSCDFNAVASNEGKVYLRRCQLGAGATFTAFSDINQVGIDDCHVFGNLTFNGCNTEMGNNYLEGIGITYTGVNGRNSSMVILGNFLNGNSSFTTVVGALSDNIIQGGNIPNGTLTVNGAITFQSDVASLPVKAQISLTGGATITYLNDALGLGYTPTTAGNWSTVPASVQAALDTLAADRLRLDGSNAMTGALNMGTHLIHNVVDPAAAQDAATKNYVDTQVGAVVSPQKQTFTLSGADIVNQFVDLTTIAKANSVLVLWNQGQPPFEGDDYTVSLTGGAGGKTRINFVAGGILNTFAAAGQKLQISSLS